MKYEDIPEIEGFKKIPLGKAQNIGGQKFGKLTTLYRTENNGRKVRWVCQCECGHIIQTEAYALTSGHTASCGCAHSELLSSAWKNRLKTERIGQKFGKLTILDYLGNGIYKCQCDCGNITNVHCSHLFNGHTTSCGCYAKELTSKRSRKNIAGQRFGKLTALYPTGKIVNEMVQWHCKCECGNEIDTLESYLASGHRLSCGCMKSSGEQLIQEILRKNNINFICQKSFINCTFNSGKRALFDFFIENKYLIEYDGEQHFRIRGGIFGDEQTFQQIQQRDAIKTQYCKDNNIPLIRIPYTAYDTLCIDDLKLETTKYRVV